MFKIGDIVNIKSKSYGKRLGSIYTYDFTKPQEITKIYSEHDPYNKIYVIQGDYYLAEDLTLVYSYEIKLDDKLFEIWQFPVPRRKHSPCIYKNSLVW